MDIKEALAELDVLDDDLWTADGAPKTDAVGALVGSKVTRAQILDVAPKFSRENNDLTAPDAPQEPEPVSEPVNADALLAFAEMDPPTPEDFHRQVLAVVDKTQLPDIEAMLIEQQTAIAEKQTELDELRRRVKINLAATRSWIKTLIPDMSNQQAIMAYIKASQSNRAEKAERLREAIGGLKPSDLAKLDPRAAIDRAFARKTARGTQRPTR